MFTTSRFHLLLTIFVTVFICSPVFALESRPLTSIPPASAKSTSSSWDVDPQTVFAFEIFVASLIVAFLITFVIGTRQNLAIARKLSSILNHALSQQFIEFGTSRGKRLLRDGSSFFWYFATGRRYTPGLTVAMDLVHRMDMFAYTSAFMSTPQKDRMIYYLPISDDVQMEALTLFIVRKKELSRLRASTDGQKRVASIEQMIANVVDVKGIPSNIIIMTEHNDIATTLLPDSIRQIIHTHSSSLVSIHITEQGSEWDTQSIMAKRLIRVEFTLPSNQSEFPALVSDMAKLTLHLLDAVATTKLSPIARKTVTDLRRRAALDLEKREQKARAEAAADRKLKKKKDEEEAVGKMSAQKQRKYEEKKRKKEIADRMRKASKK